MFALMFELQIDCPWLFSLGAAPVYNSLCEINWGEGGGLHEKVMEWQSQHMSCCSKTA